MSTEFDLAYARLNPQQKIAVDTIDGPVMVLAGPGTGKTQVLAARIGQLLRQTDVEPRGILALTFTDAAATTMRKRLAQLIGQEAYKVQISTFHAFCAQVLSEHPESFALERDSQPLTELERHEILETLLNELPLEELRPLNRPLFYLKDCVRAISQLKREYVSPVSLRELVQSELDLLEQGETKASPAQRRILEKKYKKQLELSLVFERYEERLRAAHRFDFDDMIGLVATAFKTDPLLLQEYQELIQYILVDEYQDTNTAQNQIVELLGSYWGQQANLFVVGDPHQSIFRFQGASLENMLRFSVTYPNAKVVTLVDGYRCGQAIYNAAHTLISAQAISFPVSLNPDIAGTLQTALSTQLKSQAANEGVVRHAQLPTQIAEQLFVADAVTQLVAQGVELSDIAILYRTNADGLALEKALATAGIRYQIERGTNALDISLIQQIIRLCTFLLHMRTAQDTDAFAIMCFDWMDVEKLAVYKMTRQAGQSERTLIQLATLSWDEFKTQQSVFDTAEHISETEFNSVHGLVEQWQSWITIEPSMPFSHWFSLILEQTKLIEWILSQPESQELLKSLQGLFSMITAAVVSDHAFTLVDFVNTVTLMQEQGIAIRQEDVRTTANAVTLSTAHSAKGKEWSHVFIYNCTDGQWGGSRTVEKLALPESILQFTNQTDRKTQAEDDDRRLLYVALTRARQSVTITYPEFVQSESKQKPQLASRFISALGSAIEEIPHASIQKFSLHAETQLPNLLRPVPTPSAATLLQSERDFFGHLVDNFALSISALNQYLADPIQFRDSALLRVPRIKDAHLSYGSAMHRALEFWQRPALLGKKPAGVDLVIAEFDKALQKEIMTQDEFQRRQKKGRQVLREYIEHASTSLQTVFSIERQFGSLRSPVFLGDIPLKGRIDRMDWIDQDLKLARVIDYKTGKPKTDGQVLATVASAELSQREQHLPETIRGPMMRQLVFYRLLADLDPSFSGTVTHGRFIFVEPNNSVKTPFVVREYEITHEAVQDLSELIIAVMAEIRSLAFLEVETVPVISNVL